MDLNKSEKAIIVLALAIAQRDDGCFSVALCENLIDFIFRHNFQTEKLNKEIALIQLGTSEGYIEELDFLNE